MTESDLKYLMPNLECFYSRFHSYFCRSEGRKWGEKYIHGLLMPIERRNVENIAEEVGAPPRKLQEFVSNSPWDDRGCINELQKIVGENFGSPNGVLVLDDTGFPKRGKFSAGVGRQYSGTLGRRDNCQIGVFLGYATLYGHTLVDRRLYIMQQWFEVESASRRVRAGIPEEIGFLTKLELGAQMLQEANRNGHLLFQWVTGDAAYGECHQLRRTVDAMNKWYCFEVSSSAQVWLEKPLLEVPPPRSKKGRKPSKPRPVGGSPESISVAEATRQFSETDWIRHRVCDGAKVPREYEFARLRVVEKRNKKPGPEAWMMARRPIGGVGGGGSLDKVKYYLSSAPTSVSFAEMSWVGCLRWTIEENFELAKGETGLDHYEVTRYRGWYHHITLSMMALTFLKTVQREWQKKNVD
jgi:SRSO17 transposase